MSLPIERVKDPYMFRIYVRYVKECVEDKDVNLREILETMFQFLKRFSIEPKIIVIEF